MRQARRPPALLRFSVALQTRSTAPAGGSAGSALTETYTTVATTWASIEGLSGARFLAGQQLEDKITHRIIIRWRDPTSFTHVLNGTDRYRVRGALDPDGTRRHLELNCEQMRAV